MFLGLYTSSVVSVSQLNTNEAEGSLAIPRSRLPVTGAGIGNPTESSVYFYLSYPGS